MPGSAKMLDRNLFRWNNANQRRRKKNKYRAKIMHCFAYFAVVWLFTYVIAAKNRNGILLQYAIYAIDAAEI